MTAEFARFPKYSKKISSRSSRWMAMRIFWKDSGAERRPLLTGHYRRLGTFFICARALRVSTALHGQANRQPEDRWAVNEYRCMSGNRPIFKNESARVMLKVLKEAGTIGILATRNHATRSAFVDFSGRWPVPRRDPRVWHCIPMRRSCRYCHLDEASGKYRLRFEPPWS